MFQLFVPDFIKSKTFQFLMFLGVLFDIFLASSLKHVLFIFGLPYLTAVLLYYLMNRKKPLVKAMVSAQYKRRN
jgi:urea transporter